MCWNAEVSLQSFLLGSLGIIVGGIYGLSFPLLFFFSTIVLMQLFEFIIWSSLKNKRVRFITSILAASLLLLQPIASILTLYPNQIMYNLLYVYCILMFLNIVHIGLYQKEPLDTFFDMYPGKNGHLVWNWIKKDESTIVSIIIYTFFLIIPLIISKRWSYMIFGMVTLMVSLITFGKENTWGSMWCWLVNLSIIYTSGNLALSKILQKN